MSYRRSSIPWTPLLAITLMTTGRLLHADNPSSTSSDGYKTITVDNDGKPVEVRVKQQPDALANANISDQLDHQRSFSAVNPMSNKTFALDETTALHGSNDYNKKSGENTFVTTSYSFDPNNPTAPNLNAKPGFHNTYDTGHSATGFEKSFPTTAADSSLNEVSPFATASAASEQGRAAALGGGTTDTYASALSDKKFEGDEAEAAKQHLKKLGNGQIEVENLPDRPLTIDEVRQLINHGFTPDTTVKPAPPTKPLNDPNYQPQPLREDPSAGSSTAPAPTPSPINEDDKDDPVPPPGMMSTPPPPENSQPLPQQ